MSIVERALDRVRLKGPVAAAPERTAEPKSEPAARAPAAPQGAASLDHKLDSIRIDYDALRAAGLLPPQSATHRVTEEFRRIKWPLVRRAFPTEDATGTDNLLLVTSSVAGEGKSFVSTNLAFSFAQERNCDVLLVDADLSKPHLSDVFGLRGRVGLTDLLSNREADPTKAILRTDCNGFRILPAGTPDPNAPELLASQRMRDLGKWLAENYSDSIILFDTPPLLATNEAQVLTEVVAQVLFVISADKTAQSLVKDAFALIAEGKPVKAVLNQVAWASQGGVYGAYGYGYGYDYGSSQNSNDKKKR